MLDYQIVMLETGTSLDLIDGEKVKYNEVVNKIGELQTRDISSSNTYSLPRTSKNMTEMGINSLDPDSVARGLNTKKACKVISRSETIIEGYLIINNVDTDSINVNFIEDKYNFIDQLAAYSVADYLSLQSKINNLPWNYVWAIEDANYYQFANDDTVTYSTIDNIQTLSHPLVYFPNSVNQVGDKYCKFLKQYESGGLSYSQQDRIFDGKINFLQSRPLFSVKALLDMACYGEGYTPYYHPSVDVDRLEKMCIASGGFDSVDTESYPTDTVEFNMPSTTAHLVKEYYIVDLRMVYEGFVFTFERSAPSATPASIGFTNLTNPPWEYWDGTYGSNSLFKRCIYTFLDSDDGQTLNISVNSSSGGLSVNWYLYAVYRNIAYNFYFETVASGSRSGTLPWGVTFNKDDVPDPQTGYEFMGVVFHTGASAGYDGARFSPLTDGVWKETYVVPSGANINEYLEFPKALDLNLMSYAPKETYLEIFSGILKNQGLLMDIRDDQVRFFDYESYYDSERAVYDWTDYHVHGKEYGFNTDYGSDFGQLNRFSLKNPFSGNYIDSGMPSQGDLSKYKPYHSHEDGLFSDVDRVNYTSLTSNPIYEQTMTKLGLLEYTGEDRSYDKYDVTSGFPSGIGYMKMVENMNYNDVPTGIQRWLEVVGERIKIKAQFIIPETVFASFDPLGVYYIEKLGGYFAVSEISEYQDGQTPVEVTLIKLRIDS